MTNEQLAQHLALLFYKSGYQWKIDGKMITPLAGDILQMLDKAVQRLYDEAEDGSSFIMTTGRLIVKRDAGHFDVYAMIGEYNPTEGEDNEDS